MFQCDAQFVLKIYEGNIDDLFYQNDDVSSVTEKYAEIE